MADILIEKYSSDFKAAQLTEGKQNRADAVNVVKGRIKEDMIPDPEAEDAICSKALGAALYKLESKVIRQLIILVLPFC